MEVAAGHLETKETEEVATPIPETLAGPSRESDINPIHQPPVVITITGGQILRGFAWSPTLAPTSTRPSQGLEQRKMKRNETLTNSRALKKLLTQM